MAKMSPSVQNYAGQYPDRAFFGEAPTLAVINRVWGKQSSEIWLIPQLVNVSEFCGSKEKLKENMLKELAKIISVEYFYLKCSELMLFFYWFKMGKYGRFYGAVDPMVITTALQDFIADRRSACAKHEQEQERQRREAMLNDKNNMTYEEYKKLKET